MARRCLETVTLDGQTHTCVVLSSEGLAALRQENYTLKNMGYPVLNSLITTFGDVWVDTRYLYNTDPYSQIVNGNNKLRNFLEGERTDSTRYNGIRLNDKVFGSDNTSANYPYNGLYRGFVVDDDTKESWLLGGVVAITASGNSALGSVYFNSPEMYCALMNMAFDTSNGGGATHIAKITGQLSSLSNNLSDILMVSGGGGGGLIIGEDTYAGKDAGGIAGSGNNSANQTTGYAFGQGESADGVSGGGGGLYGGYKGGTS